MGIGFFTLGIYPGSEDLIVSNDLKALFMPLYGYMSHGGPGFDNLFYSMTGSLGSGFYGTTVLCFSPFDIVFRLVPLRSIPDALYFMILIKVGLCGLSFFCFSDRTFNERISDAMILLFSSCYALMSYNFMYFLAPMWYDIVILLPVLALSLEKMIKGRKSISFVLLMSFCFIDDYYIAYMAAVSLIFYVIFRLSEEKIGFREAIKRFMNFALSGIWSLLLSSFVIIPVILDFRRGKLSESASYTQGVLIKNSLFDVLRSLGPQSYAGVGNNVSPNIFCGTAVLILAIMFFVFGRKNIRSRITGILITAFYFVSFIYGPLDRAWHGFRDPVNFCVRYAFTFSFLMICFALRGTEIAKEQIEKRLKKKKQMILTFVFLFTCIELFVNGSYILANVGVECGYGIRSEFDKYCDVADELIPYDEMSTVSGYGRLMTNYEYTNYDGALFGYDGLSRFSSSYNLRFSDFLRDIGIGSIYQTSTEFGLTPPTFGLFGGKYYISYWLDESDLYTPLKSFNGYTLYENENALPMAFEISGSQDHECSAFSEDPYDNIDIIYGELFGGLQDCDSLIFKRIDLEDSGERVSEGTEGIRSIHDYLFKTISGGHYYSFGSYIVDEYPDSTASNTIRECYVDGSRSGSYGNRKYCTCLDLGCLNGEEDHILTVCSSNEDIGDVWLYYYDEDAYEKISGACNGFELVSIGKKGMTFKGTVDDPSEIFLSLPFEDGYRIYVDGEKTEYDSYRDLFITVPVDSGSHVIEIGYVPKGLIPGIIISIVALLVIPFYGMVQDKLFACKEE